ncbi:hypothetical protein NQ317_004258 [Molorchus minor]|uniref:Uncharacterized protein n=1 Tax=Molorchus minor TaxID=1323400 RepID=A0ABQ9JZ31_9CUCU|nr:hypothetical protein NQ317_004258 [Molorchus minor]
MTPERSVCVLPCPAVFHHGLETLRPYLKPSFGGTESWRHSHNPLPAIKNKPSSTLTTGNVGVNIVKVIQ